MFNYVGGGGSAVTRWITSPGSGVRIPVEPWNISGTLFSVLRQSRSLALVHQYCGASRILVLYHRARKRTMGSIRNELGYRTRIPCFRICLYNRCTCLEVLREFNPDRKIQESRSQRPYRRSLSKFAAPCKICPERTQTNKHKLIYRAFLLHEFWRCFLYCCFILS